jgi:CBS domain-containing protein
MSTIADVLASKASTEIHTIAPDATVFEGISRMVQRGVGALLVRGSQGLLGIVTERDYLRKVALEGRTSRTTSIEEIMTAPVVVVCSRDKLDYCMALMTERRVRHLPVVDDGRLTGIVSMGDLVAKQVDDQKTEIGRLVEYIQTGGSMVV